MGFRESHYQSGEKICPGDRVTWAGRPGRVIFVLGSSENSPVDADSQGWLAETETAGFMLEVEGIGQVFERYSDEDLEFKDRRA